MCVNLATNFDHSRTVGFTIVCKMSLQCLLVKFVLSHADIYLLYQGIFYIVQLWIVFVIMRILLNRGSVAYILL